MIRVGDVFDVLPTLESGSVRCCVTSPPYWGLRDYGTATWEGGDEGCDHLGDFKRTQAGFNERYFGKEYDSDKQGDLRESFRSICGKCGAVRIDSQLGLEETPEQYVENMVRVFREVRRVLKDDGTLWLNLGDSYAGSWGAQGRTGQMADRSVVSARQIEAHPKRASRTGSIPEGSGLKPKDLVGIPWRIAFALQRDGAASPETMDMVDRIRVALLTDFDTWEDVPDRTRAAIESLDREWADAHRGAWWLRSDIIWHKPNPMPESVTDRPTKAHEYIFLLTKSARYYYDHEAIAETSNGVGGGGWSGNYAEAQPHHGAMNLERPRETGKRNRRSVWTITTQPFPEAHFAVMPETIASLCVQAGSAISDTVLDPFAGAGTTGVVAQKLGREFVGVELNPEYAEMARKRIDGTPLSLFAQETS